MVVLIIILIAILILVIIGFYSLRFYSLNIIFYSKNDTNRFLLLDPDNYIENMSKLDLQARGNLKKSVYKKLSSNYASDFSQNEKQIINNLMKLVKNNFKNTMYSQLFNYICIIFAKTNKIYENSYPHTRYNIIFLSPLFFSKNKIMINTLEHECIHLFQRYFPITTQNYLNKLGFKKIGDFKTLFSELYKLKRSNPDIDNNIWLDPNGNLMFPIFNSINATSLNDVESHNMEHPYEWMAYR